MRELAAGLEGTKFPLLSRDGGNLKVEGVGERFKCELSIKPLIDLEDDGAEPSTKKKRKKGRGQGQKKVKVKDRRNSQRVHERAIESRRDIAAVRYSARLERRERIGRRRERGRRQ